MSEKIIELEVKGIDIFDENIVDFLQGNFPEVLWSFSDGKVIASFFYQDSTPLTTAQNFVRKILEAKIGASSFRWHDDLVGYAEIALRTGLSSEGIRKWKKRERGDVDFPEPRTQVGTGQHRSPIWSWSEILKCLQDSGKYSNEIEYPTFEDICMINAAIIWMTSDSYQSVTLETQTTFSGVITDLTGLKYSGSNLPEGAR